MISDKQKKILAFPYSKYDAIICDGAVRSGKTSIMSVAFVNWAMDNYSRQRFGFCGKTVDSCWKNLVLPLTAMSYIRNKYTVRVKRSEKIIEISRGGVINYFEIFGGKDEGSAALIQGRTLAGVLLDEVALMPESFVNQALARCSVDGAKLWFSCNPDNPMHWFYVNWIQRHRERNALYLHFSMRDNPSLSEKTLERYESMYSGVFYDRYIKGLWAAAEGLIYGPQDANIVDAVPKQGEYYISCDYGTLNPFSAGLWCWDGKTATRIREYYYSGRETQENKTDEEYYAELEKLAGDLPVKSIIIDPSAASMIEVIRRHRRFPVRKAVNDVVPGIATVARYLRDGTIKIHRCCKNSIREFGLYRWDDKSTEDRPIKENDHCLTGDTMVETVSGPVRIDRLVGKSGHVYCTNGKQTKIGYFHSVRMTQNNAEVFEIELKNGKTVKATADHPFLTKRGWVLLKDLRSDDQIACIGGTYGNDKIQRKQNSCIFRWLQISKRLKNRIFSSSKKTDLNKRERLHCYVWRFFHGSIPEGYHIHHKDEDKDNNELQNLICIPESEHIRLHSRENAAKNKNSIKQNLKENALPSAIAWHKSEAGKLWHSAHQRQTIENLEPKKYICKYCGKVFYKLPLGGTKFCSNNCKAAYRRKTGADNEKRICAVCGREFYVNKYAKTKTCSKKCATALRWDKVNHPHRETTGL